MDNKTGVLMGRYEIGRILGQGSFGKVYYARRIVNNRSVAIKVIDKEKVMRVGQMDQIKREISIMRLVRHPNIVHLYEVLATKTRIYYVIEYAKGGELFDRVARRRLQEAVAQKYFRQLINAVDFCHSRGVYHRDIKPENLLLNENENLKVTDFGLGALDESKRQDGLLHTTCGTPAYVAPEVIHQKGYDGAKADIWSCGVVLYVLLAGYLPFRDANIMELYRKIEKADFRFPSSFPRDVRRLLVRILDPNPETRISIAKIKEQPWFRKDLTSKSPESGLNTDGNPGPSGCSCIDLEEVQQDMIRPKEMNAFNIISLSCGFNLSNLFEQRDPKDEARFTSRHPATIIISRLIETAKRLRFDIKQIEKGWLNFERLTVGKRGAMSIDAQIFELTPELFLVEMRKSNGHTVEYQKMLEEEIRPALQDIVWAWQDEKQHHQAQQQAQQPPLQQQEEEQSLRLKL